MGRPPLTQSDTEIGRNLRILRESRGVSRRDLAARLGISYQQLQKYEKGASALSCLRLYELSQILQAPYEAFYSAPNKGSFSYPAINPAVMTRALKLQKITNRTQQAKILKIIDILTA